MRPIRTVPVVFTVIFLLLPAMAHAYTAGPHAVELCRLYKSMRAAEAAAGQALRDFKAGRIEGRELYRLRSAAVQARQAHDIAWGRLPASQRAGFSAWCLGLKDGSLPFGNRQGAKNPGAGVFRPTGDEADLCKAHKRFNALVKKYKGRPKGKIPFGDALLLRVMPEAVKAFNAKYPDRADRMWAWCYGRRIATKPPVPPARTETPPPPPPPGAEKSVIITLYMPATPALQRWRKRIFGPAFPRFRKARITGHAGWRAGTLSGDAANQVIKAVLWHKGKAVRHVSVKTTQYGDFTIALEVNRAAGGTRQFRVDITRRAKAGVIGQKSRPAEPGGKPKVAGSETGLPAIKVDKQGKKLFDQLSRFNAIYNDFKHNMWGGKGTPNLDQWRRNEKTGRSYANGLKFIHDSASSPIKGAGDFQNYNNLYKRLTGRNLPGVKKAGSKGGSAMKEAGKNFARWLKYRNKAVKAVK